MNVLRKPWIDRELPEQIEFLSIIYTVTWVVGLGWLIAAIFGGSDFFRLEIFVDRLRPVLLAYN